MNIRRLVYLGALALAATAVFCALRWRDTGAQAAADSEVLAVVNGRKITRKEVDERAGSQLQSLEGKIYQLRKSALNGVIRDLLLEEEARRQGVSPEELKGRARAGDGGLPAGLRGRNRVEVLLKPPPPVRVEVSTEGPSKGSPEAPLVLVEFSDYECPACRKTDPLVKELLAEYGDQVRLVYKHLPLPMHKGAFGAAQAAFCAGEQERFWEMHDLLFAQADGLSPDAFKGYAAGLGLDAAAFGKCLDSEASRAAVSRDLEEARAAGIRATPSFVLNGNLVRGAAELKGLIEQELQAVNSGR